MTELIQEGAVALNRRTGTDRRTHKHDELFRYAVSVNYFVELRKSDRRQPRVEIPENTQN